jgi:hypothetical protein
MNRVKDLPCLRKLCCIFVAQQGADAWSSASSHNRETAGQALLAWTAKDKNKDWH